MLIHLQCHARRCEYMLGDQVTGAIITQMRHDDMVIVSILHVSDKPAKRGV